MSTDNQEAASDIAAELRRQSNEEHAFATRLRSGDCDDVDFARACCYDEDAKYLSQIADRLEAAAKRESPTTEKSSAVGNAAAMREALEAALPIMRNCPFTHYNTTEVDVVVSKMNAALSAPPRNCDAFNDAESAWRAWLDDKDNWDEFGSPKLELYEWLYALAKPETKGENNGR